MTSKDRPTATITTPYSTLGQSGRLGSEQVAAFIRMRMVMTEDKISLMSRNYWLLLEKSDDTRISKGIDGYQDQTGETYQYDSLVPNHKNLATGDFVVLRKENEILGVGAIGGISEGDDVKVHLVLPR